MKIHRHAAGQLLRPRATSLKLAARNVISGAALPALVRINASIRAALREACLRKIRVPLLSRPPRMSYNYCGRGRRGRIGGGPLRVYLSGLRPDIDRCVRGARTGVNSFFLPAAVFTGAPPDVREPLPGPPPGIDCGRGRGGMMPSARRANG